jgi:carboxypeptidase C (cathepsin A)
MPIIIAALTIAATAWQDPGQTQGPGQGQFPGGAPGGGQGQRQGRTAAPAGGGEPTPTAPMIEIAPSITHHTVNLPSGAIAYTATAAQIPLRSDTGEVECRMFSVTYAKDGAEAHTRPVTFAFNGGPGSATMWLHMGALGPKRAPMNDDGTLPTPPYEPVDNMDSWLDFTDVVVIDAPGTGFSRIARPDLASRYFGVQPDIAAFTTFIRNWLTLHHRWRSPLFVAGESYGGIRGSGLSASLFRAGIALSGFVSISGTSNFMTLDGMRGNDATYIGFLPSMAAVAWYHKKLGPRFHDVASVVKEVQEWIDKEYAAALQRGDSLTEREKDHVAEKLSEYLGVPQKFCRASNLRITEQVYFRQLLMDDGLMVGRYDGRLIGKEELRTGMPAGRGGPGGGGVGDPSDDATTAPFTTSLNAYLEDDLGIKTEIPYLNSGNVRPWTEPEGSYAETATDLRNTLARNQHFRVLYCCGYYDLACPLNATMYTVNHMGLDAETRSHIAFQYYPAGHMMYIERSSRKKLHDDVAKFESGILAGR